MPTIAITDVNKGDRRFLFFIDLRGPRLIATFRSYSQG